ncbi:MAG: acyltransferase family protein [Hallerella porci]|uniref:acyltransferase family protein n=1 Tax=Hallerella TaxID=2815788 RepID=UPI000D07FA79|nr:MULTISPECIES: acyltransferase family protein [Hallerella]MCI5600628.1 acyltransferase family protein [Hallerella sp.]MDY3921146.1 acyltransferase family protein [Hallerella porci]
MQAISERIGWIDECKGFILLLVCLFHLEQSFVHIQLGMLHGAALRMSAFFFLSGMLFSNRRFSTWKSYAQHKTKVLLVPYILLSLFFLALDPVLYQFDAFFPLSPKMNILGIYPDIQNAFQYLGWNLVKIFIAGKSSIGSGPLWFVFNLYAISLLFFAIHQFTSGRKIFLFLFALLCLGFGFFLNRFHLHFPFGFERICTTFFFFALGNLCKNFLLRFEKQKLFVLLLAFFFAAIFYAIFEKPDPNFSIMNNDLGKNFGVFILSSLSGIFALLALFLILNRMPSWKIILVFKGILRNISRNGMIILATHWWILLVLRIVFKSELDKPFWAWISLPIVFLGVIFFIPLFRSKLNRLIAKEKISWRESLSIR